VDLLPGKTGKYVFVSGVLVKVSDRARLRSSVHWPHKAHSDGRLIEHLSPEPTFVSTKSSYRELLRKSGAQEAG